MNVTFHVNKKCISLVKFLVFCDVGLVFMDIFVDITTLEVHACNSMLQTCYIVVLVVRFVYTCIA